MDFCVFCDKVIEFMESIECTQLAEQYEQHLDKIISNIHQSAYKGKTQKSIFLSYAYIRLVKGGNFMSKELEKVLEASAMAKGDGWKQESGVFIAEDKPLLLF